MVHVGNIFTFLWILWVFLKVYSNSECNWVVGNPQSTATEQCDRAMLLFFFIMQQVSFHLAVFCHYMARCLPPGVTHGP